eukprot:3736990-Rhodomonas_salina.1
MAKASDVLASDKRLKQQHFMVKRANRGNCALCYATKPGKGGEKQVVTFCEDCSVMLHADHCFKEWHTKKNPKSIYV